MDRPCSPDRRRDHYGLLGAAQSLTDGGNWNAVDLVLRANGLDVVTLENAVPLVVGRA